ncbi:hypothetical protein H7F33_18060 [Pedobacter sp. PAMC26386]|nr:hypothetical protein H7F33_18060 [Pedobacter sp. PAMC26386]
MSEKVEFKKLREFGDIINDTIRFFKENFKPLIKVFFYFCGLFIVAGIIASISQQLGMKQVFRNIAGMNSYAGLQNIFTVSYFAVVFIAMINYTAMNISVISFIALYVEKGNVAPTVDEVWGYFKYYFLRVFGSGLLLGMFMTACFCLCLIPGFYVFPAVSLMIPIMIFENSSLGYAFSRSFKLLKENWWMTAATLFVLWIIAYATSSLMSLPAIILTAISTLTNGIQGLSVGVIIFSTILQSICQFFLIVPLIGVSLCYFNLSERQNSTGLMERIQQMNQKNDAFPSRDENSFPGKEEY